MYDKVVGQAGWHPQNAKEKEKSKKIFPSAGKESKKS